MFRTEVTLTALELALLGIVDPQGALEALTGAASEALQGEDYQGEDMFGDLQ